MPRYTAGPAALGAQAIVVLTDQNDEDDQKQKVRESAKGQKQNPALSQSAVLRALTPPIFLPGVLSGVAPLSCSHNLTFDAVD